MSDENSNSGLSDKHVEAVQKSWEEMKKDRKKIGLSFFIELFKAHPDIRAFFKVFDGMSQEELQGSKRLQAHAVNFMSGVGSYVENLDDLETVIILIQKTASSHFRRKIKPQQFRDALGFFMKFLTEMESKKGSDKDQFLLDSWDIVLKTVGNVLEQSLNNMAAQKGGE